MSIKLKNGQKSKPLLCSDDHMNPKYTKKSNKGKKKDKNVAFVLVFLKHLALLLFCHLLTQFHGLQTSFSILNVP